MATSWKNGTWPDFTELVDQVRLVLSGQRIIRRQMKAFKSQKHISLVECKKIVEKASIETKIEPIR